MRCSRSIATFVALAFPLLAAISLPAADTVPPLPQAHSHNDYEHARPLLDALDQGFCSVEADIYLVDGQLLVAHDRPKVKPERTLQALYLDPLRQRVQANGGRVFRDGPPVTLLIDLKSNGAATYARLREVLANYRSMLSVFRPGRIETNAVTVILSGDRPFAVLAAETERLAGLDGRMADLDRSPAYPVDLVPLVSDAWRSHFQWNGQDHIPEAENQKLRQFVTKAHQQGRLIRFWGAADRPEMWKAQADAGVDLVNTDHLPELARFLRTSSPADAPR